MDFCVEEIRFFTVKDWKCMLVCVALVLNDWRKRIKTTQNHMKNIDTHPAHAIMKTDKIVTKPNETYKNHNQKVKEDMTKWQ